MQCHELLRLFWSRLRHRQNFISESDEVVLHGISFMLRAQCRSPTKVSALDTIMCSCNACTGESAQNC